MSSSDARAHPQLGQSRPLVPPLYQSSVYTLPDLDVLDLIMDGTQPGFVYARDGHPNAQYLSQAISQLESADWTVICGSGMAAVSCTILSMAEAGDRILASSFLYGKTTQLLRDELSRFGIEVVFVDMCQLEAVERALAEPFRLVFVETISNPLLRIVDIEALAQLSRKAGAALVVDNTFATPVICKPLELGAGIVIESLTKMLGGHSDVTLGSISGNGDQRIQVQAVCSTWGFTSNPFDCWLASRGLGSAALRVNAAIHNAQRLAEWLMDQPGVSRVIYPGLDGHPDHHLAKEQFGGRFGNIMCFELSGGRAAVNQFLRQAPEIPFSPSLGHVTTTLSHPALTSHRLASPAEKRRLGITDGLIRLSVGCEDFEVIQRALAKGLRS